MLNREGYPLSPSLFDGVYAVVQAMSIAGEIPKSYFIVDTWTFTTSTATPTGNDTVRTNNANMSLATAVYITSMCNGSKDYKEMLDNLKPGHLIRIQDENLATNYARYTISGMPVRIGAVGANGAYYTIPVTLAEFGAGVANNQQSAVSFRS